MRLIDSVESHVSRIPPILMTRTSMKQYTDQKIALEWASG